MTKPRHKVKELSEKDILEFELGHGIIRFFGTNDPDWTERRKAIEERLKELLR